MPIDVAVAGTSTAPAAFSWDWKTASLYALGIGAKRDELDYLYEGRGPKVYPTFAVVPAMTVVGECLGRTKGNLAMVVHGGQSVVAHRPIPPEAKTLTIGTIKAIYDLKRFAQVLITTSTRTEAGEALFDTEWSIIFRGEGGWGGEPPPKREDHAVPKDRPADMRIEEQTSPEQALLYRLSGDLNPLHADPEFAKAVGFPQGPILHGLATYGFAARALAKGLFGGDATKIRRIDAGFRKPVWPGDTLMTEAWKLDGGKIVYAVSVKERSEQVVTGAWAEAG